MHRLAQDAGWAGDLEPWLQAVHPGSGEQAAECERPQQVRPPPPQRQAQRKRYGGVDGVNEAWSTAFWSQRYDDLEEVLPPRVNPAFANPAQQLDFQRFSSDEMLDCFLMEKEIIREHSPDLPVTTNMLGLWKPVDFFAWAKHQDVISHDSYPDPHDPDTHIEVAYNYDLMRSLGGGAPWLLMEQAPSAVNWRDRNAPKAPGQMRLWSYQTIARGSDSVPTASGLIGIWLPSLQD